MPSARPAKSILRNVHFRVICNLVLCYFRFPRRTGRSANKPGKNSASHFDTLPGKCVAIALTRWPSSNGVMAGACVMAAPDPGAALIIALVTLGSRSTAARRAQRRLLH